MIFNIARQRGPLGPDMSIWPCLAASDHEIHHFHHTQNSLSHLKLSHMDFLDATAATHGCRLIISRATQDESPNEYINPEIWRNNHLRFTYSFGLILLAITLADIISSCACIVLLSEASSSSHVILQHCASTSETAIWPCLTASKHEICYILSCSRDLGRIQSFSYGFS